MTQNVEKVSVKKCVWASKKPWQRNVLKCVAYAVSWGDQLRLLGPNIYMFSCSRYILTPGWRQVCWPKKFYLAPISKAEFQIYE